MMVNPLRGEIEAELNGTHYRLCLTLGALAALEKMLDCSTVLGVIDRFKNNQFTSHDLIAIISAGLYGAGHGFSYEDVAAMTTNGAVPSFITIAADLLQVSFAPSSEPHTNPL
jgi:hypothetical protein